LMMKIQHRHIPFHATWAVIKARHLHGGGPYIPIWFLSGTL
jgi:hypothetical protein